MKLFVGVKTYSRRLEQESTFYIININERLKATMLYKARGVNPHTKWGFAWDNDTLYCTDADEGILEYDKSVVLKNKHSVATFVGAPEKQGNADNIGNMFNRPHQKLKVGKYVYFTDTAHNEIKRFDVDTKKVISKSFLGQKWLNTINYINDDLYIVAHNTGKPSALIKTDLDLNILDITRNIGFANHNVWEMGGKLWTCDSEGGFIKTLDGTQVVDIGEYPRGIAMNDKYLLVGVTKKRTSITKYQVRFRKVKSDIVTTGGIAILNRDTLEISKFINLASVLDCALTDVFEIRLMDEKDHAMYSDKTCFNLEVS